ncbi:hypothetical protein J7E62_32955 [Variovorax paradoxus]|nr:hypothetical protein [Variovorax paradoxus]
MDKDSKPGLGSFSGNSIIAVVLLTIGALFVRELPLETTRLPVNEARLAQHQSLQDIDARLWQDPFSAVAKARADARKKQPDKADDEERRRRSHQELLGDIKKRMDARSVQDLQRRAAANSFGAIEQRPQRVEILAIMLPGGPYSENVESRRRARYAVLAGLNASRLAPADTEHLGYFFPHSGSDAASSPTEPVPFEWFEPALDVRRREAGALPPLVLVMWLQSEAFSSEPLRRMKELAEQFCWPGVSWRVLGPNGSDGLKAMIDEAAEPGFTERVDMSSVPIRFYSPYATVPDRVLLADRPAEEKSLSLAAFFETRHVKLVRTIGDDGSLADRLTSELKLRGLTPRELGRLEDGDDAVSYREACLARADGRNPSPSHIAVVAEWDTLYGRSLRREFRASEEEPGFCVSRFTYVRGLDGQMPASGDGAANSAGSSKQSQGDKDAGRRKDGSFTEMAEGQSQFDYLHRLAMQMHAQDRRIRKSSADGLGLRAIGVLGSDLHDKLLVLRALQPEFPNVVFFTTDLDARLLHPREQAWTRNLVVASNFGLQLAEGLQGGVPPFRDSYQTSTFLSTRLAIDDAQRLARPVDPAVPDKSEPLSQARLTKWFSKPRVFEIGRTAAFDFSTPAEGPRARAAASCRTSDWTQCKQIHPPGSARFPAPREAVLFALFSLVVLALWAPALLVVARESRKALLRFVRRASGPWASAARFGVLAGLVALLQIALPFWMAANWPDFAEWLTREGKPMLAFEGISLWPTEATRLFTLLLCIYLVFRGWVTLTHNLDEISRTLRLGKTRRRLLCEQRRIDKRLHWWQRLIQMFSMRFAPSPAPEHESAQDMPVCALVFWQRYVVQNRIGARLIRTLAYVAAAVPLSWLLVLAFGEDRFVPERGDLSRMAHDGLRIPALVMMYFLVFFVVDATAFCVGFVRGLRHQTSNWPDTTLKLFEHRLGVRREYLDNWIDLQFIALRTRCVTRLIYYPFIVISLLLLSRSPAFDHWPLPGGTLALAAIGAAVALGCAMALRLAAEASRRKALDLVKDALMRANGKPPATSPLADGTLLDQPTAKQLELLQAHMQNLREGAFAPFWQQPLLKAVLLPFATIGGTTLLDYLALVNI